MRKHLQTIREMKADQYQLFQPEWTWGNLLFLIVSKLRSAKSPDLILKGGWMVALILCSSLLFAQSYNMDGSPINDCGGFFYDSGGNAGNYGDSESFTTTICSDGTGGTHVQLIFSVVDLAGGDELCFFDGPTASDPPLSCNTDFTPGNPFIIQATAANTSGCLTITFNSDGSGAGAGWQADINCIAACQTIQAVLTGSDPPVMPVDTGYIDICVGDRVFFFGAGEYPQDGVVYNHSDLTSSFEWDFGDGVSGLGPNVSHIYDEPGGYVVQLTITDQFGCTNTNFITQRVRVSTFPSFGIYGGLPDQICAGDTISLNAVVNDPDSTYNVGVTSNEGSFQTEGVRSDSLALPDGTGAAYETSIAFSNFSPGQVLTSMDDLLSICVIMEHSWMRDLEISLQCPDGTSIILHDHPGNFGGEVFLGEPFEADETLPEPIPGVGYEYCWTADATNGTWLEYANSTGVGTLPPGDYNSFDPLSDLLGCPLNGEWTIHVEDLWGIDNGFIFEWSIQFAPALFPNIETFTPNIVNYNWVTNESIFFQTNDSISASPQNAGTANYIFQVEDDFGCAYDTSLSITVLPPTHPDCYSCPEPDQTLIDQNICDGDAVQLDATNTTSLGNQDITFEAFPNYIFGNANHPPNDPYEAPLEVNSINPGTIINGQQQICGVCVDIATDFDADIRIFLRSPSGQLMELSTNNGGAGDNYTGTCFTPTATTNIVGSSAPFTGDFIPEGSWSDLNGSVINGTWELWVSDDFGVNDFGELISWSICFTNENDITYDWSPSDGLSCIDCPDPVASPTATTTYQIDIADDFGCLYSDSIEINVVNNIPAPLSVVCDTMYGGNIEFVWDPVPGYSTYQVNINGTGWVLANGTNSHILGGLTNGTEITIEVRVQISGSADCGIETISTTCTYFVCDLFVEVGQTTPPTCFNTSDGVAVINAFSGQSPFSFSLDNMPSQNLGIFNSVTTGDHTVVVMDNEGCMDSITFNIPVTDSIYIEVAVDSVTCNGNSDGAAVVTGFGGVGNFTYSWNTSPNVTFSDTISNVVAGIYEVTAIDGNNCQVVENIEIFEPAVLEGIITPTFVSCNGGNDGAALVSPTGGVGPFNYLWSNGQTTSTASFLIADVYSVTVTDNNGCTFESSVDIVEPLGLNVLIDSVDVVCFAGNNGEILLDVSGGTMPYTYLWSDLSTDEDRFNLTADQYCVTVTDASGCTEEHCITIEQPEEIILSLAATPTTCVNNNNDGTASVSAVGGTGTNYTYLWSNNETNSTAQSLIPGNYCVTVTDGNMCTAVDCIEVTAPEAVTIDMVVPTDVLCNGDNTGSAEVIPSGGDGNFTYLWSDPLAQFANPASNLGVGTYTVLVTDGNGCTAIGSVQIGEPPVLTTSINNESVNCFGGNDGTATANPLGGVGPYTYAWNSVPVQTTATASNLLSGNYNVTVTDANGCTVEQTTFVDQPATAVTAIGSQSFTGCFGEDNSEATVVPSGGTGTNYTYQWSNVPSSTSTTATNLSPQTYTVTVTDENGCEATTSVIVDELDDIVVNVIQVEPTCFGDADGQLGVNIVTGGLGNGNLNEYNYFWENGNNTMLNTNLGSGNYTLTVSDAQGCSSITQVTLDQPSEIIATGVVEDAHCNNAADGSIAVTATGDNNTFTYLWDAAANNQTTATAVNLPAGIYSVVVTDNTGCTATASFGVEEPKAIEIEFTTVDNLCSGDKNGEITTFVSGGFPHYSFEWTSSDTAGIFSSTDSNLINLDQGLYTVTVTDANSCTLVDSVLVEAPTVLFGVSEADSVSCFGEEDGVIYVEPHGGVGPYTFSQDGENFFGSSTFLGLGAGAYTIYIQDANGCKAQISRTIGEPEEIVVDLGDNFHINMGKLAELRAEVTPPGNYLYFWSPPDSLTCDNCQVTYAQGLLYQTSFSVEVMDQFGCTAQDVVTVFVNKNRRVFVPTGFSPNGHSLNQLLRTHGREGTIVKSFRVFSRWGEMVYENTEPYPINAPDIGWDGTFKGQDMNPGVFVWSLEVEYIDGATDVFKGNTTLIR